MKLASFTLICAFLLHSTASFAAEYLIQLKDGRTTSHLTQSDAANGNHAESSIRNIRALKYTPNTYVVESAQSVVELKKNPNILHAEPNFKIHVLALSNDPYRDRNWGLNNSDVKGADIHVAPLWQAGYTGSKRVIVAVLDTGVDYRHADLAANIYRNSGESDNGQDNDRNGFVGDIHGWNCVDKNNNPMDVFGHGSHVAGIIGAVGNNGVGTAGVNWNVSILPVKMLGDDGTGDLASSLDGINYAILMKATVINASWGGDPYSQIFADTLKRAGQQGVLFVAAAGNDSADNDQAEFYPADYRLDNVISVAATDNYDNLASFSNYGANNVDVAAPGNEILSTTPNNSYKYLSGTSMAAPFVTGLVALLKSVNPSWSAQEIKQRIISSCDPVPALRGLVRCGGRINAYKAATLGGNLPSPGTPPANPGTPAKPGNPGNPPMKPPVNPIDEKLWRKANINFESKHPYLDNSETIFPISIPGAKYIRVHFSKVETEDFDVIYFEDLDGKIFDAIKGNKINYTSKPLTGDNAKIRFLTDLSEHYYGFSIDYVEYVPN